MKFHCPNCNAKYRISEEKFASHPNPKLRCKQCATVFSVRTALEAEQLAPSPETVPPSPGPLPPPPRAGMGAKHSTASVPPPARLSLVNDSLTVTAPSEPPPPTPAAAPAPRPAPRGLAPRPVGATALGATTPGAATPGVPGPPPPRSAATPGLAPRPAAGAGLSPRALAPKPTGLPRSALEPVAPPEPEAPAAPARVPAAPEVNQPLGEAGSTPVESAAAWSVAAFSSSEVAAATSSSAMPPVTAFTSSALPSATLAGWYLEQDGSPLGPLDETALRARAEAGVLLDDTLVWREELDDWKEALHYPVLGRLIAEARSSAPIARAAVPAKAIGATAPIADAPANAASPIAAVPAVPALPPTLLGSGASVSDWGPIAPAQISAAAVPSSRLSWQAEPAAPGFSAAILAAAIFVSLAVGFGAGYVMFGKETQPTANAPAQPEAPIGNGLAQGAAPPPPPPELPANSAAAPESGTQGRTDKKSGGRKETSGGEGSRAEGDTASAGGGLLAGLGEAQTGDGPQANVGGNGRGSSGPSLDANQIQSTVQKNQPSVRRNCWQRALSSAAGAPAGARVTVTIKIAPSGSVTSVNHSGEAAGYPGLAGCIAMRVKEWSFPKAGGPTTAEVPFVFAAQ